MNGSKRFAAAPSVDHQSFKASDHHHDVKSDVAFFVPDDPNALTSTRPRNSPHAMMLADINRQLTELAQGPGGMQATQEFVHQDVPEMVLERQSMEPDFDGHFVLDGATNQLIKLFLNNGEKARALDLAMTIRNNIENSEVLPLDNVIVVLITLEANELYQEVLDFYIMIQNKENTPSSVTINNTFLNAFNRLHQYENTISVLDLMIEEDKPLNLYSYRLGLYACVYLKDAAKAEQYLDDREILGWDVCFSDLRYGILAAVGARDLERALRWHEDLVTGDLICSAYCYAFGNLLAVLQTEGQYEQTITLYHSLFSGPDRLVPMNFQILSSVYKSLVATHQRSAAFSFLNDASVPPSYTATPATTLSPGVLIGASLKDLLKVALHVPDPPLILQCLKKVVALKLSLPPPVAVACLAAFFPDSAEKTTTLTHPTPAQQDALYWICAHATRLNTTVPRLQAVLPQGLSSTTRSEYKHYDTRDGGLAIRSEVALAKRDHQSFLKVVVESLQLKRPVDLEAPTDAQLSKALILLFSNRKVVHTRSALQRGNDRQVTEEALAPAVLHLLYGDDTLPWLAPSVWKLAVRKASKADCPGLLLELMDRASCAENASALVQELDAFLMSTILKDFCRYGNATVVAQLLTHMASREIPVDIVNCAGVACMCFALERYDECVRYYERVMAQDPLFANEISHLKLASLVKTAKIRLHAVDKECVTNPQTSPVPVGLS